jgi:hypothetical protein
MGTTISYCTNNHIGVFLFDLFQCILINTRKGIDDIQQNDDVPFPMPSKLVVRLIPKQLPSPIAVHVS